MNNTTTKIFCYSILASILLNVSPFMAEGAYVDPATRLRLAPYIDASLSRAEYTDPYVPLLIQIKDEDVVSTLQERGTIIYNHRDDIYLTSVPVEVLNDILEMPGINNISTTGIMYSDMDTGRPAVEMPAVNAGIDGIVYTGRGVVVGFSDIGFDAHHINFGDRVREVWAYDTPNGMVRSAITDQELAEWTTDEPENFHATHVAGIMTGSFRGNEYYGIATGSDIVATTSRLYDSGILAGVEQIIRYAKDHDQRAVINMSLGDHLGPHDGTDLECRYLSMCADDAILCLSAGNAGHLKCSARQDLSVDMAQLYIVSNTSAGGFKTDGMAEVWSDDNRKFEYAFGVYDCDANTVVALSGWAHADEELRWTSESDPEMAKYLTGTVYAEASVSNLNDRYCMALICDTWSDTKSDRGDFSKYFLYLAVRAIEEDSDAPAVTLFADRANVIFGSVAGSATKPTADGSISNLCTADGVISVGMLCTRNVTPNIYGEAVTWRQQVGRIFDRSSYSDMQGIKRLPTISAPGAPIVSSVSRYYWQNNPDIPIAAVNVVDGIEYPWFAAEGTSMSSPLVAGVIALWLEADPTLTRDEIIDIACATANRDYPGISDPRWGAGCIDAYAGLEEVLRRASLHDHGYFTDIKILPDGRIDTSGLDILRLEVYNLQGVRCDVLSPLRPGIYIVKYAGKTMKYAVH